jgi:ubiquinone/menaquinone biosynthesis C-methylase UbiE
MLNNINSDYMYLDFGCGNGIKTEQFASMFEIDIKNTYGVDIENWGPYTSKRKFKFKFKPLGENNKIHYKDNTFDLVSCFVCLHHIPNLIETLKEIKRVLKPNGHLLILDHNAFIDLDVIILDIQHNLYTHIYNEKNKKIYNRFFNIIEWDYILSKLQFKFITSQNYQERFLQIRYDHQFYGLYLNIK